MLIPPRRAAVLSLYLGLCALGCWAGSSPLPRPARAAESAPPWFEDVTDALGLDFVHDPGPTGSYFMPQSVGSGAAFIHDGDDLYVYLLQGAGPESPSVNRLYKWVDGKLRDVTEGSGL